MSLACSPLFSATALSLRRIRPTFSSQICRRLKSEYQSPTAFSSQSGSSTDREEDQWKHRPPYEIHQNGKNGEDFKAVWNGKCHCGKVQYQLSREKALASKYCHCTTCQRLHGAPFQWATIFHKEDINFTQGVHDLGWYDPTNKSTTHHLPCKVSCAYCRAPIMDEGRNMILLFPGLVDEIMSPKGREAFKATCHMFYNSRVVDFHGDGITKFEGLDSQSNILDDDGNVIDRYNKDKGKYESELGEDGEPLDQNGDDEDEKKRKRHSDSNNKSKKSK